MLRVVVTTAVALAVALAVPPTVGATEPVPASGASGQCVLFTLVPSESSEPHAEVYIAKETPLPLPPENPSPSDLVPYIDQVVAHAIEQIQLTEPTSGTGDILVEVIVPANSDAGTDGYRIGVLLDLSNCSVP